MPSVSEIAIYPIKACGQQSLSIAEVEARGLTGDRRLMIVDGAGRFVTQRERPELRHVQVMLAGARLRVEAPGQPVLETAAGSPGGARSKVHVWEDTVEAVERRELSELLGRFLGSQVRVVELPDGVVRRVNPKHARPGDQVSFADGYPILVTTTGSLRDLEARAGRDLGMARFRPNVVIDLEAPWVEEVHSHLRIGEVVLRLVKPCARCVVTTLDPLGPGSSREPLATLASYRKKDGEVFFGMNAIPERMGVIRVGDVASFEGRR